ncbi:hypothetical protein GOP47_0004220 [Adiantum capillus-veneris]|uniref:Uncharacterized protein n=1 Tax=Adiantum capillus-veneris TaxID=13818 RepID=A0A9D4ZPC9_ADICA|nr:hypothetical protein GOP47_0004220 [Adiantum capillus-veneris]
MMVMRHAARALVSTSRQQQQPATPMVMMMMGPRASRLCRSLARMPLNGCVGSAASTAAFSTTPLAQFKGPSFIRLYLQLLETRPILTKSFTAATIFCLADATSQGIKIALASKEDALHWDFPRSFRMLAAGLFLSGPTLHFWFNLMSTTFPSRDVASTLKKMALGQTVYGPIFNTIFFSLNAYLQGETTPEVISRLKRDLFPALKNGLMYWPLCDFLTYRYVPVHLQPLVNNSFAYVWTIYLTYMASLKKT